MLFVWGLSISRRPLISWFRAVQAIIDMIALGWSYAVREQELVPAVYLLADGFAEAAPGALVCSAQRRVRRA
jgi:hypothetical protein